MTKAPQFRRYKESTIHAVLCHIRAEIIRDSLDGLCHVEALLRARGVDPEAQPVPQARPRRFKRGQLSRAVLRALKDGPATANDIAARISNAPGTARSVASALTNLHSAGLVVVVSPARGRIRQVWGRSQVSVRYSNLCRNAP